jgi:hypothetical protein
MTKYYVSVPEVHYQQVSIEADTPQQAAILVNDGEGESVDDTLEYSHTLEGGLRVVTDINTNKRYTVSLEEEEEDD